jgi:hypothetical protein
LYKFNWLSLAVFACTLALTACGGGDDRGSSGLNLSAAVTTLAGDGTVGWVDDPIGTNARFNFPCGIATDGANLYVADANNHSIRKIVIASGAVTSLAGGGTSGWVDDPVGINARFNFPFGFAIDGVNLYVADTDNHRIRKIVIAGGAVTTLAGDGTLGWVDDPVGANARFNFPVGMATDGVNLYVADSSNNRIRKIVIASGAVTTLAGGGTSGWVDDPVGTNARFDFPTGIATDGVNLYVADRSNHRIRKIVIASGAVTTLVGGGTLGWVDDPVGTNARFYSPYDITTDGANLYVADANNDRIRKID